MSKPKKDMSNQKRFEAALRAEVDRIWQEADGAPAATAVKYDSKAQAVQLQITFTQDTSDTEATASVKRFVDLFKRKAHLPGLGRPAEIHKSQKGTVAPSPEVTVPKSLQEAIGFAKPATVQLLRLIPLIREGLQSLKERHANSFLECSRLKSLGVVDHELGSLSKSLIEIKEVLDGLTGLVERFHFFDQTETVFLDDPEDWLDMGRQCLGLERFEGAHLLKIEDALERLAAKS